MSKATVASRQNSQPAKELQVNSMAPESAMASGDMSGSAHDMAAANNAKRESYPHLGNMPKSGDGKF